MINQAELRAKFNPEGSELRSIQHQLMDVMLELDRICQENDIPYMITGGNVLGAVRHGGFIPWDDDMDIALLKNDYRRLINVLRNYKSDLYVLQEHRSDPDYINTFPKFRLKEGNLLGSLPQRGRLYKYKGCGIDIFCMTPISKFNSRVSSSLHRRLLGGVYRIENEKVRHFVTSIRWMICQVLFRCCNLLNVFHKPGELHHAQAQGIFKSIRSDTLLPYKRIPYEDAMLPVPQDTDHFLELYFGHGYMELPQSVQIHNKTLLGADNE